MCVLAQVQLPDGGRSVSDPRIANPARVTVTREEGHYFVTIASELGIWELDLTESVLAAVQAEQQKQQQTLETLGLALAGALERAEAVEVEAKVLRTKLTQSRALVQELVSKA